MLIFTYKFEKYIKHKVFPRILLVPDKYIIKGSFRRRVPYVTDIDVVNEVYPQINKYNIYEKVIEQIVKLGDPGNSDLILVYVICGTDERFRPIDGSDEEINRIMELLYDDEKEEINLVLNKYSNDEEKKLFFLEESLKKYYKLRWTIEEILNNEKILRGNISVTFEDVAKNNTSLLFRYFVKVNSYPVGIDVVVNYEPIDMMKAYGQAAEHQLKYSNYNREYYFMLFPFKYYFRKDRKISSELEDLIEKKFGLYKQLLVRIETYSKLYSTNNLDIRTATGIVTSIIKDLTRLPDFKSNIPNKIREVAMDNPPEVKMSQWEVLLNVLYDELIWTLNSLAKKYFYKYLKIIPDDLRNKFCLNEESTEFEDCENENSRDFESESDSESESESENESDTPINSNG